MNATYESELYHHGVKGQKWGVRRYQNADGSLTAAGKKKYEQGIYNKYGVNTTMTYKKQMQKGIDKINSDKFNKYSNKKKAKIIAKTMNNFAAYNEGMRWASAKISEQAYLKDKALKGSINTGNKKKAAKTERQIKELQEHYEHIGQQRIKTMSTLDNTIREEHINILKGQEYAIRNSSVVMNQIYWGYGASVKTHTVQQLRKEKHKK